MGLHGRKTLPEIDLDTIVRNGNSPEQAIRLNARIEVVDLDWLGWVGPQTGVKDIYSHQCEGPLLHSALRVAEDALHEAHV